MENSVIHSRLMDMLLSKDVDGRIFDILLDSATKIKQLIIHDCPPLNEDEFTLLIRKDKLNALKKYRERTSVSLGNAVIVIECFAS